MRLISRAMSGLRGPWGGTPGRRPGGDLCQGKPPDARVSSHRPLTLEDLTPRERLELAGMLAALADPAFPDAPIAAGLERLARQLKSRGVEL